MKRKIPIWVWVIGGILVVGGLSSVFGPKSPKLTVSIVPSNAQIKFQGNTYTGKFESETLEKGSYTVDAFANGYKSQKQTIQVEKPETIVFTLIAKTPAELSAEKAALDKVRREVAAKEAVERKAEAERVAAEQRAQAEQTRIAEEQAEIASAPLEVVNWECRTELDDYLVAVGKVRNRSSEVLENVQAVLEAHDENGLVDSSDSLLEYQRLRPDETSPFKVMVNTGGRGNQCILDFKELMGDRIGWVKAK